MRISSIGDALIQSIRAKATETSFSGVLSVDAGEFTFEGASGQRDRANRLENTCQTRFGIASGTKGFTALGIAALIQDGKLGLDTTARSVVGDIIRSLDPEITVRHLTAAHVRSWRPL